MTTEILISGDEQYARHNTLYWTKRAPGYSAVNQEELSSNQRHVWSRALKTRIDALGLSQDNHRIHVLDVGTGPGFFAVLLAHMGYQVTAVDCTEAMLDNARANAAREGVLDRIRFEQSDAQCLAFSDETFDVVVSRNLTWNLRHPEKAYLEWVRVLKKTGGILNFDANWYRYLYDETFAAGHRRDRANVKRLHAADDTANTDVDHMQAIAREAFLSRRLRPQWDLTILSNLGLSAQAQLDAYKELWTPTEYINNASTPMFCITARRSVPCASVP